MGNWRMPTSSASRPDRATRPATTSTLEPGPPSGKSARATPSSPTRNDACAGNRTRSPSTVTPPASEKSTSSATSLVGPRACARNVSAPVARLLPPVRCSIWMPVPSNVRSNRGGDSQLRSSISHSAMRPSAPNVPPHMPIATRGTCSTPLDSFAPESRTTDAPGGTWVDGPASNATAGGPVSPSLRVSTSVLRTSSASPTRRSARTCSMPSSALPAKGRNASGSSARGANRLQVTVASMRRPSKVASASMWPPSGDASARWSTRTRPACGSATT